MTGRINKADLEILVVRINNLTGSPMDYCQPYIKGVPFKANIGNFHLDWAYGGVQLVRVCSDGGGISQPLGGGFHTKSEMYYLLHAYIRGLEMNQN